MTSLIYALRWLTDTLPLNQQTTTYRLRQIEMKRWLERFRTSGFGG